MKEMTINEVHEIALDIMKEIHECCVSNNIYYSLGYGSLIGAIRHKGFIPWDDDIDVWMTRPNFEKFTRLYKSKHGYRLSSEYDKDSLICFNRIYETKKTYLKRSMKSCDGNVGVWVDIMPLDGVPDDDKKRIEQYKDFVSRNAELTESRCWLNSIENINGIGNCVSLLRQFVGNLRRGKMYILSKSGAKRIQANMVDISKKYSFETGKYCSYFQCGSAYAKRKQELLPVKSFSKYHLTNFEGVDLMIISDYDNILKLIYGDYMKLPPEDARKFHHGVCFWK